MKKLILLLAVCFTTLTVTAQTNQAGAAKQKTAKVDGTTSATPKANKAAAPAAQSADKAKAAAPSTTKTQEAAAPAETETMTAEEFIAYLEKCGKYFLATVEGDQPKIRPFSFCAAINGKPYFMTRKHKDVYKQLVVNPKVQIAAYNEEGKREWMRITCKLVEEETPEVRTIFLDKYPAMKKAHPLDDPEYAFMKLVDITAVIGKKTYTVK